MLNPLFVKSSEYYVFQGKFNIDRLIIDYFPAIVALMLYGSFYFSNRLECDVFGSTINILFYIQMIVQWILLLEVASMVRI